VLDGVIDAVAVAVHVKGNRVVIVNVVTVGLVKLVEKVEVLLVVCHPAFVAIK
jgi:hypothetical protein